MSFNQFIQNVEHEVKGKYLLKFRQHLTCLWLIYVQEGGGVAKLIP